MIVLISSHFISSHLISSHLTSSHLTISQSSCHRKWSVSNQPGFGLVDGEVVERVWQHLNSHAPASTQMTLGNRQDHFFLLVTKVRDRLTKHLVTRLRNNFDKGAATYSKSECLLMSLETTMSVDEDGTSWSRGQSLKLSEGWGDGMDTDGLTALEEYICAVFE